MIQVKELALSQEHMEAWFTTINDGTYPMLQAGGIVASIEPEFVSCSYEEKTLTLAFRAKDWELNPEHGLHGGILVTYLDTVFGFLCHYLAEQREVCTVSINTSFLKPILLDDRVLCTAKVNSLGRTIVSMTGEARLERKNMLAGTANTTFMMINKLVK